MATVERRSSVHDRLDDMKSWPAQMREKRRERFACFHFEVPLRRPTLASCSQYHRRSLTCMRSGPVI
eukprot:4130685-Prymnesium_polylepis.1